MKKFRLHIPIRLKIIGLIAGALTFSLLSYLYVGTTLIVGDKISYIYDYNLAQVSSVANNLDTRIQKAVMGTRFSVFTLGANENTSLLKDAFEKNLIPQGVAHLSVLRDESGRLEVSQEHHGPIEINSKALLVELNWTPEEFKKNDLQIEILSNGTLAVAGLVPIENNKNLYFLSVLDLQKVPLSLDNDRIALYVLDPRGKELSLQRSSALVIQSSMLQAIVQGIDTRQFQSGVQEHELQKEDYILAYEKMPSTELLILGLIPKSMAFEAAEALTKRSLLLGISILLLATGLTVLFVRQLTQNIRQVWRATQRISEGDFLSRVELKSSGNDEVGDLARSFNFMAEKISDLMSQTAQKARMEKELETAQEVQSRFFPAGSLKNKILTLHGASRPASECGGDWWHYAEIGNKTLVVIGDVTGHGVSAALVTAAAHGVFSNYARKQQKNNQLSISLLDLVSEMNTGVHSAASGQSSMTFFATLIDKNTGHVEYANAAHNSPYLYRPSLREKTSDARKLFKPLLASPVPALGRHDEIEANIGTLQLEPGDILFWYTDGLIECRNPDGQILTRMKLLRQLADVFQSSSTDGQEICNTIDQQTTDFFGSRINELEDDLTIIVASISPTAQFQKADQAA
jgi:phosphoserine phosphatase RsbU/P